METEMRMMTRLLALAFVSAALSSRAAAQESADLTPKFKAGQETRYTIELSDKQEMKAAGHPDLPARVTERRIGVLLRTKQAAETGATIELVCEKCAVTVKQGPDGGSFDSTRPADEDKGDLMAAALRPAIGRSATIKVNAKGEIESLTLSPELRPVFGDERHARSMLAPILTTWCVGPKSAVGATWTHDDTEMTEEDAPVKTTITHRLESIRVGEARVSTTGKVEVFPAKGAKAPPFTISECKVSGAYTWDTDAGSLKELRADVALTIKEPSQGIDATERSESSVKITRVK